MCSRRAKATERPKSSCVFWSQFNTEYWGRCYPTLLLYMQCNCKGYIHTQESYLPNVKEAWHWRRITVGSREVHCCMQYMLQICKFSNGYILGHFELEQALKWIVTVSKLVTFYSNNCCFDSSYLSPLKVNHVLLMAAAPVRCRHNIALHVAMQLQLRALRWSPSQLPPLLQRDAPCKPVMWLFTARRMRASASSSSAPWTDRRTPPSSVSCFCLSP